ncbi:MAG: helix-turn-helix transcriptional regulator [Clostridia bacterium]|nr:helix-turn-helix transcriptional regulator [Clostridia bacterium]
MRTLTQLYYPITGTPFQQDETYREAAPCLALRPYIRCFWGSERPLPGKPSDTEGLVIPDTCMDIIFHIDYANNRISSTFCTLDERSYRTPGCTDEGGLSATFAIRFYAWTACLFAEDSLRASANSHFPVDAFFRRIERALLPVLFEETTLEGKICAAEPVLLSLVRPDKADTAVLDAVHHMLITDGRARIGEISAALALSPRQLERRFDAMLGVSPKTFSSLLRYQRLWQDMVLSPRFNALDAVDKYGFTDQAHLLSDFRKRHLMSPKEALEFARK